MNVDYFEVQFADFFTEHTIFSDFFRESSVQKNAGNYCVIHTGEDDAVRYYLQATACEFTNRKLYANTCAIGNLKFALVTAFRNHAEAIDIFKNTPRRSGPDVEEIIKYMQTNYRNISLSQTAEKFHYNSTHISRLLYAHYQKTFMEILTEIRLQRAKDYLNKTNKDIAEIAQLSTNDASGEKPLGEVSESTSKEDFDTTTIAGAIEYIIAYAKETWNCPVIFYTNPKYDNAHYESMVALLKEIAEKWEIDLINFWDDDEINQMIETDRKSLLYVFIHPRPGFYLDVWTPYFENAIAEVINK